MSVAKYISLEDNEDIVHIVRQYSLVYWWRFLVGIALIIGGFFFLFWFVSHGIVGQIAVVFILLVGFGYFFGTLSRWKKNVLIFTNQRLFVVTSQHVFDRTVAIVTYDMIEHVSGSIQGILPTIFRYGFLSIHTLGNTPIHFFPVKSPTRAEQVVHTLVASYRRQIRRGRV